MSRLSNIQTTKTKKPVRVLIYGVEGVGKSTFGAKAPNPIFIAPEGGTDEIQGAHEMPSIYTFDDVVESIKELTYGKHSYQTVVIDSADWVEKLAHSKIIGTSGHSIIHAKGGYGAGYRESEMLHKGLIDQLSMLRDKRSMNVIVTAHYHVKTVKDPEAVQDYDAFEIKCHEMVSSLWREWVDCVLFARFKTYTKSEDGKEKALALGTGERVMYTEKRPAFQAKNRYGLPFELSVSWEEFINARNKGGGEFDTLVPEITELKAKISDKELVSKIDMALAQAGNDSVKLTGIRDRLIHITRGAA